MSKLAGANSKRQSKYPQVKIGDDYGRLAVQEAAGRDKEGKRLWKCICACKTEKIARDHGLRAGSIKSCGCLKVDVAKMHGKKNATHGGRKDTEYRCWISMISRCHNPNHDAFHNYGGRGIIVCDRWRNSYKAFLEDMGRRPSPSHTLDRHPDTNGNYEPGNVRWATHKEQSRNKRDNLIVTINGVSRCLIEWAEVSGIGENTLRRRVQRGWPPERLLEPVQVIYSHRRTGA